VNQHGLLNSFSVHCLSPPLGVRLGVLKPAGTDDVHLCKCKTVTNSLLSACDAFQGAEWIITYDTLCLCRSSFMYLPSGGSNG